jgi:hypothetical protein
MFPVMGVTKHVRFDLTARNQDFIEGVGVRQCASLGILRVRIVMCKYDGRLVGACVQRRAEPLKLVFAQLARRDVHFVERIQHEPIGVRRLDEGDML